MSASWPPECKVPPHSRQNPRDAITTELNGHYHNSVEILLLKAVETFAIGEPQEVSRGAATSQRDDVQ